MGDEGTSRVKVPKALSAIALAAALVAGLAACSPRARPPPEPPPPPPTPAQIAATAGHGTEKATVAAEEPPRTADNYFARVTVSSKEFEVGGTAGELLVYVGPENFVRNVQVAPDMTASKPVNLHAAGAYAKVSPRGTGFTFESETPGNGCFGLKQGGSYFPYKMTPDATDKPGPYRVGASVLLYDEPDCRGAPVSKPTEDITVTVHVKSSVSKGFSQIGAITWNGFKNFWYGLVALVFALILFLIRKKFAQWFGFKDKDDSSK